MKTFAVSTIWKYTSTTTTRVGTTENTEVRHRLRLVKATNEYEAFALVYDGLIKDEMQDASLASKLVVDTALIDKEEANTSALANGGHLDEQSS